MKASSSFLAELSKGPISEIKRNSSFVLESQQRLRRRSEGRHDRRHDMVFDGFYRCFERRGTRHGRRPKSVRGPSRRVWEATTTVFSGLTRGSRIHRSRYENRDELCNQNVQPSMVLPESEMKRATKNKTARRESVVNDMLFAMLHRFPII